MAGYLEKCYGAADKKEIGLTFVSPVLFIISFGGQLSGMTSILKLII
jgi:hypothetical protein